MPGMRRVAIVVFEGLQSLDAVGPAEVFSQASRLADSGYEVALVGRAADTTSGLSIGPLTSFAEHAGPLDTLMVAGGLGVSEAQRDPELLAWVRAAAGRSRRVTSVCSGAFILARAGLLDGRRATTHWDSCALLARRYPAVTVEPDPIYVRDGNVYTSAGVTAGMDLALALVEEDLGADVAMEVARRLVLFARRPGGQAQFSVQLAAQSAGPGPMRELQAWIAEHPDADLSVGALAERVHMSARTLARAFAREVGMTPAAYVEAVRVEQARSRLESGGGALAAVARACGFGTAETMRRAFHRRLGVAPADYRTRFHTPTPGDHDADRHPPLRAVHGA
ncbi:MAG: cdhR [Solirubrobacterales bacterium]|nr:cdhR [Solirubrobacterales bacterium]